MSIRVFRAGPRFFPRAAYNSPAPRLEEPLRGQARKQEVLFANTLRSPLYFALLHRPVRYSKKLMR